MQTLANGLPEKVCLNGADCFYLALEKHAKGHKAGGNTIRIFYSLDAVFKKNEFQDILNRSPLIHWLCNIELVSGKFLRKPFWKYADKGKQIPLTEHLNSPEGTIPSEILSREIMLGSEWLIEADLIHYPSGKSGFVISWNHILMDGKGMGLLLKHLEDIWDNKEIRLTELFPKPQKEPGLYDYIRNMYKVKHFIQLSSRAPIFSMTDAKQVASHPLAYYPIVFTKDETLQITDNATKTGAPFGINLYLMAACMKVVHLRDPDMKRQGDLWLPVPYNGRQRGSGGSIITNSILFHFYRIPRAQLSDLKETVTNLSSQMKSQMKIDMPASYNKLLDMMCYIPTWLYYFLVNASSKGSFASFLYTLTGENLQYTKSIFGKPVRDIQLYSPGTYPPGMTFCFYRFDEQLRINLCYASSLFNVSELKTLENDLRKILLTS